MDREVIERRLESLRRCLQRVAEKCPSNPDKKVVGFRNIAVHHYDEGTSSIEGWLERIPRTALQWFST